MEDTIDQWFSTGVTSHPIVTWAWIRGDTKSPREKEEKNQFFRKLSYCYLLPKFISAFLMLLTFII